MSLPRRFTPEPRRRGWCPGLSRPMPTGDGLLARVHPPLGVLTLAQVRAVTEGARRHGNGHLDVTARANLQIRGVTEPTRGPLAHLLGAAGLGDVRDDGGPQRLTLTSPLAGRDPAEVIDVPRLASAIEAAGLAVPGLPAKTLVAVEGRIGVEPAEADFAVRASDPGRVAIAVADAEGSVALGGCAEDEAAAAVAALLAAFAQTGRRRARDLSADERRAHSGALPPPPSAGEGDPRRGAGEGSDAAGCDRHDPTGSGAPLSPPAAQGTLPRRGGRDGFGTHAPHPPAGLTPLAPGLVTLALEAPFGRCTADALDRLAEAAADLGAADIRLSPARGFVLIVPDGPRVAARAAALAEDFIIAADDPRRAVAACTGAPACASGETATLVDAPRLARAFRALGARGLRAHVSGCAKGCAHPGAADLTLVGRDGGYGVVLDGAAGDPPLRHLPIEAVLERLRMAETAGLHSVFGCGAAGYGRDGRPA